MDANQHPDRFFEMFIAEQQMVAAAGIDAKAIEAAAIALAGDRVAPG